MRCHFFNGGYGFCLFNEMFKLIQKILQYPKMNDWNPEVLKLEEDIHQVTLQLCFLRIRIQSWRSDEASIAWLVIQETMIAAVEIFIPTNFMRWDRVVVSCFQMDPSYELRHFSCPRPKTGDAWIRDTHMTRNGEMMKSKIIHQTLESLMSLNDLTILGGRVYQK